MSDSASDHTDSDPSQRADAPTQAESSWDFPGWGTAENITDLDSSKVRIRHLDSGQIRKLGVWASTAICGNDITSSCLYVTGIAAFYAGPYAPISLVIVALVLFLFRGVYAEVGSALPLNGGAYNVLLNTTTKRQAAVAACLTILSYIATAVVSAHTAMSYAHDLYSRLDVFWATLSLLGLFAALSIIGMTESARLAVVIFVTHILTLILLVTICAFALHSAPLMLAANWHQPTSTGAWHAIFFGFAAAMLGISGFESSANFIEEQQPGVFPKTLRNMWAIVSIFNPVISLLALSLLPLRAIAGHPGDLLAHLGLVASGRWLSSVVSVDAVLVLSGAVLTSYVGVTGLMRRMSLDRCLPQFLLTENKWRRTNHWIILLFFALCASILFLTHGRLLVLGGVYTIAFLGVMCLFAVGNLLLKIKRARLPRHIRAPWPAVVIALGATSAALVGNILLNPDYVLVFLLYFAIAAVVVGVVMMRVRLLRIMLSVSEGWLERLHESNTRFSQRIKQVIRRINQEQIVFFTEDEGLPLLNEMALYVLQNEENQWLRVVHCYTDRAAVPAKLGTNIATIDHIYPELRIDLLLVRGEFGPQLIEQLARRLGIPKNYMFIGTPSDRFPHSLASLGGVRLIM